MIDKPSHYVLIGPFTDDAAMSIAWTLTADHSLVSFERNLGQLGPDQPGDDNITMTFSREQWRYLAVAAMKLKGSGVINSEYAVPLLRALALRIAAVTGKEL